MVAMPTGQRPAPIEFLTDKQLVSSVKDDMPRVPDLIADGVAFLYPTKEDAAKNAKLGGTGFLIGVDAPKATKALGQPASIPFLISNRHVVWDGGAPVARFNQRDGRRSTILDFDFSDWTPHPDGDDVAAVCAFGLLNRAEDKISAAHSNMLLTKETAEAADIGPGDDVFMVGRFVNHQGREQIQPAVRFGNISMKPEPIWHHQYRRDQLSYAVEMRSRTGFSGSPVISYRTPKSNVLAELPEGFDVGWCLLGVNWGFIIDEDGENTWLNGVVPAWKIIELLREPKLKKQFEAADSAAAKGSTSAVVGLSGVSAEPEPNAKDENPSHKEDFSRLLDAAARTPKSTD